MESIEFIEAFKEMSEIQQNEIKCLGEQIAILKREQDELKDALGRLIKNVKDLWEVSELIYSEGKE